MKTKIAKDLLKIQAVFLRPDEPFTWASGIKSPIYCDNRLTLSDHQVRLDVENGLAELVKTHYPEAEVLMGTSTAGIATLPLPPTCWRSPWDMFALARRIMDGKTKLRASWFPDKRWW